MKRKYEWGDIQLSPLIAHQSNANPVAKMGRHSPELRKQFQEMLMEKVSNV